MNERFNEKNHRTRRAIRLLTVAVKPTRTTVCLYIKIGLNQVPNVEIRTKETKTVRAYNRLMHLNQMLLLLCRGSVIGCILKNIYKQ